MKRTEISPAVEKAIAERQPLAASHFWLVLRDNEIVCIGGDTKSRPAISIACFTDNQIKEGFVSSEWNRIESKIATLLQQRKKPDLREKRFVELFK